MIFKIFGNLFHFCPFGVTDGNKMFVIIAEPKIGLIEKLVFFDVAEHFQRTAALAKVIIIGKKVAEILL